MSERSPRVEGSGWGRIDVAGLGRFRDAKLWPGGGRAWDWNETGTAHQPGIQLADVTELLDHGAEAVVLSRGRQLRLQTRPETLAFLQDRDVTVIHEETGTAIDSYNRLADDGRRVGALIHTTC